MASPLSLYPYNPAPQPSQSGPYGGIPGPVQIPNPFGDLSSVLPSLPQANAQVGSNLMSELGGRLSPEVLQNLQNASATYAAKAGMPGTNAIPGDLFNQQNLLSNVQTTQQRQAQGLKDYASLIPTISSTQTVTPSLQADIASRNATMAAAPDPTQANNLAQQLFDQYMRNMRGPGGGTASRTSPAGGPDDTSNWKAREADYNAFWNPQNPSSGAGGGSAIGPPEPLVPDSSYPDFGSTLGIPNDAWNNTMFDF